MEAEGLSSVDWAAPWFAPFSDAGREIATAQDWRYELNSVAGARDIRNHGGERIRFVAADSAAAEPYEVFIARTGKVPTRATAHDVFNALVWLRLPTTKARLNHLQASVIARAGVSATRGALRDALTLLDENGVFLVTQRPDLIGLLRAHQWTALFIQQRTAWASSVRVIAFGHALLQKLMCPYKSVTAHALHLSLEPEASLEAIDQYAASALSERLSPSSLMPLPVLGIPGWCEPNSDPIFYEDSAVFRPVNMRRGINKERGAKRFDETRRS